MWPNDFRQPEAGYASTAEHADPEEPRDGVQAAGESHDADEGGLGITQRYFEDISRLRVLNSAEEQDYVRRMQRGDDEAREVLITHNLRLVVYIAKRYLHQTRQAPRMKSEPPHVGCYKSRRPSLCSAAILIGS